MALAFFQWVGKNALDLLTGDADEPSPENAKEEIIDLQCGRTVFHGVPAQMRTELWLSQMHRDREAVQAMEQFSHLISRDLAPVVEAEIEKDLHRTYPGHWRFSTAEGQRALYHVLKAYACADPGIGYTQGMNFVAGLVLSYIDDPAAAFGVLWLVMRGRGLRDCYRPDMAMLQVRLWQLGRLLPRRLATHLEAAGVLPVLYASGWFLTCFASQFPLPFAARIMDLVVSDCYAAPIMKVALEIMRGAAPLLMETEDLEVAVEYLKRDIPRWPLESLQEMLSVGLARPWTSRQLAVLAEANGVESVAEAVARVAGGGGHQAASTANSSSEMPQACVVGDSDQSPSEPTTDRRRSTTSSSAGSELHAAQRAAAADMERTLGRTTTARGQSTEVSSGAARPARVSAASTRPATMRPGLANSQQHRLISSEALKALSAQLQARIEPEIGAHVRLDSGLSAALERFSSGPGDDGKPAKGGWHYAGFNLVFADLRRRSCAYLSNGGARQECRSVPPGVHGLSNRCMDDACSCKLAEGKRQLQALMQGHAGELDDGLIAKVFEVMSAPEVLDSDPAHLPPSGYGAEFESWSSALFLRPKIMSFGEGGWYGTRCQTILAVRRNGSGLLVERSLRWDADTPPAGALPGDPGSGWTAPTKVAFTVDMSPTGDACAAEE